MTGSDEAEGSTCSTPEKGEQSVPSYSRAWMPRWIEAFAKHRSVTSACQAADVDRKTAYNNRKTDKAFADAWDHAVGQANDDLVTSAMRRAIEGTLRPLMHKGEQCVDAKGQPMFERVYETALTIFMLKMHLPESYNLAPTSTGLEGSVNELARAIRGAVQTTDGGGDVAEAPAEE